MTVRLNLSVVLMFRDMSKKGAITSFLKTDLEMDSLSLNAIAR